MICWNKDMPLEKLREFQLEGINSQIDLLRKSGSKACSRFDAVGSKLECFADLEKIPLMWAEDIIEQGTALVCVPQREIKRIVSLRTTGTERAKRIYFTRSDLEYTVTFFAEGMSQLCGKGDRVAILMPGRSSDGITGLLSEGLRRIGAIPEAPHIDASYDELARQCEGVHTIVAMPGTLRRLALKAPHINPKNVLLSADYISHACIQTIKRIWNSDIFIHYGMTETCYGFAVDCPHHQGMHIRNEDYYVEIVDPVTHMPLPNGQKGLVVITSLRREAMPLIRYCTGDIGVMTSERCGCGHSLPRLVRIFGRAAALGKSPNICELDEILMSFDSVLDYTAAAGEGTLKVCVLPDGDYCAVKQDLMKAYPNMDISIYELAEHINDGTYKRSLWGI